LLQRLSVYIGHPTYTLAIVLFSMLLFTGVGSMWSDAIGQGRRRQLAVPALIAAALALIALVLPTAIRTTITAGLAVRTLVVLAFAAPLSALLGLCFPIGVRLSRSTPSIIAWAWGINGAFGVLASIVGVAISMWLSIDTNFWIAGGLYLALIGPMSVMAHDESASVTWTRAR
jgi:hypothetical protein